ncbi:MAG: hypothetical protein WC238_04820 [Parcubacteria group bacterium]
MADNLDQIRFVITCDLDDPEMNNPAIRAVMDDILNLEYHYGNSRTKIEACNADVPPDGWDILLLASDDMIPVVKGWDTIIKAKMEENFPDLDGVLHFWDGHQKDHINTLSIMGKKWYDRWGYIYNPAYRTMWCDTEYTEVSRMFGREAYSREVIIEHQHPYNHDTPWDELYKRNEQDSGFDAQLFQRRKANNFYIHSVMIIQQGRVGDILICLPIAKHYADQNMVVYWFCLKEYHNLFRGINYVTPVTQPVKVSHVVDLSFGWYETPVQAWWDKHQQNFESFVAAKYHLAGVNLQKRWKLEWHRDYMRERDLFHRVMGIGDRTDYILTQEETHIGKFITCSKPNKIELHQVGDFSIFDWYEIIRGASEIHCIDSALSNFIEAVPEFWGIEKHIYLRAREKDSDYFLRSIYKNNWIYE